MNGKERISLFDRSGWLIALVFLVAAPPVLAQGPTSTDDRLVIELVAREPDIVTPTGIAVDEQGRVWVIENHTHQRPPNYTGPPSDRIRIFSDFDAQGRARQIRTFAEGFKNAMSIALGPNGVVYLATRSDIYRMRDTRGQDVADERRVIVKLQTPGDYPHNGLAGFAFDALGHMYFSLGENLGAPYKLIGADGTTLQGGGEGGSIYRCRPDGTGLIRIATGFWNTFHLAIDGFGRLFAVDNDPDDRGPCRLLHIIPGGDYGYRFRNGRKGLHPFTAWNGELPGTLPMVAGTSEAPSGIVAYESNGLPPEYLGNLLVTSWGDHVVERFQLVPRGASFTSKAQTVIRGGDDFRPVGIVTAPDGSLYLSDWVDKSYPVHGKGRIWRIRMKKPPVDDGLRASMVATLNDVARLRELLHHPKGEIRAAAGGALARSVPVGTSDHLRVLNEDPNLRARMAALWTSVKADKNLAAGHGVFYGMTNKAAQVRAEAVRLYGELAPLEPEKRREKDLLDWGMKDSSAAVRLQSILQFRTRPSLEAVVPVLADPDPFLASAALEVLGRRGNTDLLLPHATVTDAKLRLGILVALRRTGDTAARKAVRRFLADPDPAVRRAAIQWVGEERLRDFAPLLNAAVSRPPVTRELFEAWLATSQFLAGTYKPGEERGGEVFVAKVVQDAAQLPALRAVALRMLRPDHPGLNVDLLQQFLASPDKTLRAEAVRTLVMRTDDPTQETLRRLAGDREAEQPLRAEAILGLAHSAPSSPATQRLLLSLLPEPVFRREVLRSLRASAGQGEVEGTVWKWWDQIAGDQAVTMEDRRELADQIVLALRTSKNADTVKRLQDLAVLAGPRPQNEAQWQTALTGQGDAAAGERVFFHVRGPRCYTCHRVDGRGGVIGPDLSTIGGALSREKLIESILAPSKEIAPRYVSWFIATRDGKTRTGVIVEEGPNSTLTIADAQGTLEVIHRTQIEERRALTTSIMPENLHELMTRREFLDLIRFLSERK
jgi:putative membrane-bound dehydrogenase-like protein